MLYNGGMDHVDAARLMKQCCRSVAATRLAPNVASQRCVARTCHVSTGGRWQWRDPRACLYHRYATSEPQVIVNRLLKFVQFEPTETNKIVN